jgi:hypothetical protein
MIKVEISLDGPRELSRPVPEDWDEWSHPRRERFIDEMEKDLIDSTVAFTITGYGEDEDP